MTYVLERGTEVTYAAAVTSLGENIKRLRKRHGITKADLARSMGVVYQRVQDWENDRYKRVELATLFKLARGLCATIDELVVGLDSDYDRVRNELVCQTGDLESGRPQDVGGPTNVDARVLERLVAEVQSEQEALRQMRKAFVELGDVATSRAESLGAVLEETARRRAR